MDKYVLYFPHLGPREVTKEQLISKLEFELEMLKSEDGASIAGRGYAWTCMESTDNSTGETWYSKYTVDEFHELLNVKGGDVT